MRVLETPPHVYSPYCIPTSVPPPHILFPYWILTLEPLLTYNPIIQWIPTLVPSSHVAFPYCIPTLDAWFIWSRYILDILLILVIMTEVFLFFNNKDRSRGNCIDQEVELMTKETNPIPRSSYAFLSCRSIETLLVKSADISKFMTDIKWCNYLWAKHVVIIDSI